MKILSFIYFLCVCNFSVLKGVEIEELNELADKAARSAYSLINKNWKYPAAEDKEASLPLSWKYEEITTTAGSTRFLSWKHEKQPDLKVALEELFNIEGLTTECSNAARLVRLYVFCSILTPQKTTALISQARQEYLHSEFNFMNQLSWSFIHGTKHTEDEGIYCFPFVNLEKYPTFKPNGADRNHNVVRMLDQTYLGFEPNFFSSPKTEEQVEQLLLERFIESKDVDSSQKEAHLQYSEIIKKTPELFRQMRTKYQGQTGFFKFNMQAVKSFLEN